jgi:hypothetical protein
MAGLTPSQQSVVQAILSQAPDQHVAESMLLGSYLESNWDPNAEAQEASGAMSYGPFMMEQGGMLTSAGYTPAEAQDPALAVHAMLPPYQAAVAQVPAAEWKKDPEGAAVTAAYLAERPAAPYQDTQGWGRVNQGWAATVQAMGQKLTPSQKAALTAQLASSPPGQLNLQNPVPTTPFPGGMWDPANWLVWPVATATNATFRAFAPLAFIMLGLIFVVAGIYVTTKGFGNIGQVAAPEPQPREEATKTAEHTAEAAAVA